MHASSEVLEIKNLHVNVEGKPVLKDFSLRVPRGEVHALMGPNGTGKSTLAKTLAAHPDYGVASGDIFLDGQSLLGLTPEAIAQKGLFLAFQYPCSIPGVTLANFIRASLQARQPQGVRFEATSFYKKLYEKMDLLKMDRSFTSRAVNEGFSGGEKKRCEVLQMLILEPRYAILDEPDSGLDVDALRIVAEGVNLLRSKNVGLLVITHYQRLLNYIVPDYVHIMDEGRIVHSGDKRLAQELDEKGYEGLRAHWSSPTATVSDNLL